MRTQLAALAHPAALSLALAAPVAAMPPALDCSLQLDIPSRIAYGETVTLHVSGLPRIGGVDIFTSWRNRTEEAHVFLVPGLTEFDFVYRWSTPEVPPLPPLEPGHHRVHAIDAAGCEATTSFHVDRT